MALKKKAKKDSLFGLLTAQSQHLITAAEQLVKAFNAEPNLRDDINYEMHEIEHAADDACHTTLNKVNQSFVLPFDREDVYSLAVALDDCVDYMDEASDGLVLYKPKALPEGIDRQMQVLRSCATLTHDLMQRLNVIDDSIKDYWIEINNLENQGDAAYREQIAALFDNGTDALEVLKMKLVLDALEDAIDSFEKLANVIESIVIKES